MLKQALLSAIFCGGLIVAGLLATSTAEARCYGGRGYHPGLGQGFRTPAYFNGGFGRGYNTGFRGGLTGHAYVQPHLPYSYFTNSRVRGVTPGIRF